MTKTFEYKKLIHTQGYIKWDSTKWDTTNKSKRKTYAQTALLLVILIELFNFRHNKALACARDFQSFWGGLSRNLLSLSTSMVTLFSTLKKNVFKWRISRTRKIRVLTGHRFSLNSENPVYRFAQRLIKI